MHTVSSGTHAKNRKHNTQQPATPSRQPPQHSTHPRAPAPRQSPGAPLWRVGCTNRAGTATGIGARTAHQQLPLMLRGHPKPHP